jgi:hypothetical protein
MHSTLVHAYRVNGACRRGPQRTESGPNPALLQPKQLPRGVHSAAPNRPDFHAHGLKAAMA